MALLLEVVAPIGKCCEDLDQHMIATHAEGCRFRRYPRGRAFELMGEMAHPGDTAVCIAWMKASMLMLSSAGTEYVCMNTGCPLTM